MEVEFTGNHSAGGLAGDGVMGKHPGKQSLPHFRTSPVFHERMGSCFTSHGTPRWPRQWTPPGLADGWFLNEVVLCAGWWVPHYSARSFCIIVSLLLTGLSKPFRLQWSVIWAGGKGFRRWSSLLIRSRGGLKQKQISEAVSIPQVVSGSIFTTVGWIALTTGHGGRRGHARIICPLALQYKHRTRISLLCRSAGVNR